MEKLKNRLEIFKKKYWKLLKILITISLFLIIILKVDLVKSIKLFKEVNLFIFIPLFLYIPALLISTIKWKISLDNKEDLWPLFKIYWISGFFSNFLPSTIGGDSYKVLKLRKKIGVKNVLESVIFDRFSGVLGLIIFCAIFSKIIFKTTNNFYLSFFSIFLLIGIIVFIIIVTLLDKNSFKIINYLKNILKKFYRKSLYLILLSFCFLTLGAISLWVYYFMFGYKINFLIILSFYCLIQIINMLPISINGWGIREGLSIYLFSLIGIPMEISLSISLISRLILFIQTGLGGIIYANTKN